MKHFEEYFIRQATLEANKSNVSKKFGAVIVTKVICSTLPV